MTPFLTILYLFTITSVTCNESDLPCEGYRPMYSPGEVLGLWNMVALFPANGFPHSLFTECSAVRFQYTNPLDTDVPNVKVKNKHNRMVLRQLYTNNTSLDVWSKDYLDFAGCFRQFLSVRSNTTKRNEHDYHSHDMQFHFLDNTIEDDNPILVQLIWNDLLSAIVYKKKPGINPEQLEVVKLFLFTLKGYEFIKVKICQ